MYAYIIYISAAATIKSTFHNFLSPAAKWFILVVIKKGF